MPRPAHDVVHHVAPAGDNAIRGHHWEGVCDAWSWAALDARLSSLVEVDRPKGERGLWIGGQLMSRADLGYRTMALLAGRSRRRASCFRPSTRSSTASCRPLAPEVQGSVYGPALDFLVGHGLARGVSAATRKAFEKDAGTGPLSSTQVADLGQRYPTIANADAPIERATRFASRGFEAASFGAPEYAACWRSPARLVQSGRTQAGRTATAVKPRAADRRVPVSAASRSCASAPRAGADQRGSCRCRRRRRRRWTARPEAMGGARTSA